jgi:hypothetical protein
VGNHMMRVLSFVAATAMFAAVGMIPVLSGQGQGRAGGAAPAAQPAGPVPRLANGKPDLSGLWNNPYSPNMAAGRGGSGGALDPKTRQPLTFARKGETFPSFPKDGQGNNKVFDLPYTEWGLKQWQIYDPVNDGDYAGNCMPFGLPRSINSPHGTQVIHHPDALAFLFEQNTWHHWVPTSASFKWPDDLPATWTGTSSGRWEGDTLVIETKNFNGYTKLDTAGHPHSKDMVLINTFTRKDSQSMEHTITVRDPKAYTQEFMNVRTWRIKNAPDVLMEYSCDENNLHGILEGAIKVWKAPESVD